MSLKKIHPAYLVAFLTLSITLLAIVFPQEAVHAALKGISIWWDVLFPSLLPFLVISELMLGLGIVHFFGTLLDPMMRPVFRIPGIGGFVMAMGFASGYMVGARLTSQLCEQKLVSREEGERLVSFTTTSDPIFLIGAVAVGFFHDPGLAGILAIAHYGTAMMIGLLYRFHGRRHETAEVQLAPKFSGPMLLRAFKAMHAARLADGRPLGTMLRDSVRSSLSLIMVIGGLVVFFSVIMEMLTSGRVMSLLYMAVDSVLRLFSIPLPLSQAVVNGFFEVTLGAKAAGSAGSGIPLIHKAAIAAFVLSWSGLSVHAQVVSLLHHTNLRYMPFLMARLLHGLLAAAAVYVLWETLGPLRKEAAAFLPSIDIVSSPWGSTLQWLFPSAGFIFAASLLLVPLLYLVYLAAKKMYELVAKSG
ncbi:sporulation integral membrane protein YlbJ [Paenibacillus hamazuiensis]|uniref:sporulation integral membrane protein YlbJ n=1 Tax=Paenibacillus hamazuiensis TaxID=2936508 RepID=UPI00200E6873|nr:sporulation integral membrane protein YlbJ [Paenibacillus hamazuiensis]